MSFFNASQSLVRLMDSIRKLEKTLVAAGVPRFLSRLPVCWLCWYYCRVLDEKIQRMEHVDRKFRKWLPIVRKMTQDGTRQRELIDIDRSMQGDIVVTRNTLWELRGFCIDIGAMFDRLGYSSARLQRRQQILLRLLEESCVAASTLIDEVAEHDRQALALLRAEQPA